MSKRGRGEDGRKVEQTGGGQGRGGEDEKEGEGKSKIYMLYNFTTYRFQYDVLRQEVKFKDQHMPALTKLKLNNKPEPLVSSSV